jgi:two-component system, NarL family, invasion response regulator UvrY
MTRILLADDHAIVRDGLKRLLTDKIGRITFGEATDAKEVLSTALKEPWDAVILDISLPGRCGLDILKDLKSQKPKLPILILSMHPEDQFGVRAIKAGAAAYIVKESAPDVLVDALRLAVAGRKFITPAIAERLAEDGVNATGGPPHENLSDREYQVLHLIAYGRTVAEIGSRLSLSVKTVSTYRTRLLQKLRLKTTAQIIRYALKNHLA